MQFKDLKSPSVIDRTLSNLAWGWKRISHSGDGKSLLLRPDLPDSDLPGLRQQMHECLETKGGEVSARTRAAVLGQAYLELDDSGRQRFLRLILDEFNIDRGALKEAAQQLLDHPDTNTDALDQIRNQLRPSWIKLFTQFNALPSGVKFLVDMRADLIRFSKQDSALKAIDKDLQGLLRSWFDIGFLDLKRITWNEPASLLEKLIDYEAVHEIHSWGDLKNRLDIDRCCYAYFHPRMPEEPLIFVQVALVNGLSGNIHDLLDQNTPATDPESADTAIFYSISNTQSGLRGVSLGDFLIKRVVDDLSKMLPNLKIFATLSPIPGFRQYLQSFQNTPEHEILTIVDNNELSLISDWLNQGDKFDYQSINDDDAAKNLMMRLGAHYLVNSKRGIGAADSVANFHLTNGARIEQICWMGDHSEQGIKRSFGLMVNYFYKLSEIEKNHESYISEGEIHYSSQIKSLIKKNLH